VRGYRSLAVYGAVAAYSFRRYSTYRIATAAGAFTNTVFGFIMAYTYIALWSQRPDLGGYDVTDAVTYVWLGQSMLMTLALFGGGFPDEFAERIRTGAVAVDLYRPTDLQLWWLAGDLGRAAFHLLGRGILPTVVGALAFDLRFPADLVTWLAFLLAVSLAVVVSFAIRFMLGLTGFWLLDSRGVEQLAGVLTLFLSGMLLPLVVFPGWLGEVALVLPWAAMLQVPADIFLGKREGEEIAALAFQAGWAAVLLLAGRVVMLRAVRKVVVQGG
jgi:viologen exporter family transport system permease protein